MKKIVCAGFCAVSGLLFALMLMPVYASADGADHSAKIMNVKNDNVMKSRLGVLIVTGEGFNSVYKDKDSKSLKANVVLFEVSQKFAELLYKEIDKRGTKAQMYINRDMDAAPMTYIPLLFVEEKRDGLLEIHVLHVKNKTENTFYLHTKYHPLEWKKDNNRDSFIVKEGTEMKYNLLDEGGDSKDTSLEKYAKDFADILSNAGYISNESEAMERAPYQNRINQKITPNPKIRSL